MPGVPVSGSQPADILEGAKWLWHVVHNNWTWIWKFRGRLPTPGCGPDPYCTSFLLHIWINGTSLFGEIRCFD